MITFDLATAAMIFVSGMLAGLAVAIIYRNDDDDFFFA